MAKPDKYLQPKAYRAWVRGKLLHWDPADDRSGPDAYTPRHDGILWEPPPKGDKARGLPREVRPSDIPIRDEGVIRGKDQ